MSSGVSAANVGKDDVTCSAVQEKKKGGSNLEYETGLTHSYATPGICSHQTDEDEQQLDDIGVGH